jgi:hypothetical protein
MMRAASLAPLQMLRGRHARKRSFPKGWRGSLPPRRIRTGRLSIRTRAHWRIDKITLD